MGLLAEGLGLIIGGSLSLAAGLGVGCGLTYLVATRLSNDIDTQNIDVHERCAIDAIVLNAKNKIAKTADKDLDQLTRLNKEKAKKAAKHIDDEKPTRNESDEKEIWTTSKGRGTFLFLIHLALFNYSSILTTFLRNLRRGLYEKNARCFSD